MEADSYGDGPDDGNPTGDEPDGGNPGGDEPDGGKPSGDDPDGGKPSGDDPDGGKPSGDDPDGGKPSGDDPDGGKPSGDDPDGGKPSGDDPDGGKPSGDAPDDAESVLNKIEKEVQQASDMGVSDENVQAIKEQTAKAIERNAKFTEPTLERGSKPKGTYEKINPKADDVTQKSIKAQNDAADFLAENGYDVEMLLEKKGGNGYGIDPTKSPDYIIDGEVFDCYSPTTGSAKNVLSTVKTKTISQAKRIVLNLQNYKGGTVDEIVTELFSRIDGDLSSLDELLIIDKGKIMRIIR